MKIREFKPSDEEQCIEIRKECWIKLLSKCYPKQISEKWINRYKKGDLIKDSKKNKIWVAEHNSKILGFISISTKGDKAEMSLIFVEYSERDKGIGKKLYEYAEKEILKKYPKIKTIIADSAWFKPSIKFYESVGFKKMKTISREGNPKDKVLRMEKRLVKKLNDLSK